MQVDQVMRWGTPKPKPTNKQEQCECGSGYMPTALELNRNRWACIKCYGKPFTVKETK